MTNKTSLLPETHLLASGAKALLPRCSTQAHNLDHEQDMAIRPTASFRWFSLSLKLGLFERKGRLIHRGVQWWSAIEYAGVDAAEQERWCGLVIDRVRLSADENATV